MKPIYSLGIMNHCSHDPSCALIKVDGNEIDLIFAEEGFLSRKKKSYHFPLRSMKYCLDHFGIKIDDVDVVTLDYVDHKRFYRTSHNYRLLVGDYIKSRLKIDRSKIKFQAHHYAHALTAFWPSGFKESAVLVADGLGSNQQTHSVFYMNEAGFVEKIFEQSGVGVGTLYALGTSALGFESGEEGKTMGLAPYGANHPEMDELLPDLRGDYYGLIADYSRQITRNPSPKLRFEINSPQNHGELYSPYYSRFAFNLQKETERCLTHIAEQALISANTRNLCFAGGVALNCVANSCIQQLDFIDAFWVQPASGDTGVAVGLALSGLEDIGIKLNKLLGKENRKKLSIPYSIDENPLEEYYKKDLEKIFESQKIVFSKFDSFKAAKYLDDKKIVALFTSGIELGPRALGHRSFLADARTSEMKSILNAKIKHRESYRPFAPMIIESMFSDYFDSSTSYHPYMLQAPKCNERAIKEVPAICHVDATARVQTVDKSVGKAYEILAAYHNLTRVPILVNTSFNDNNEPIVFTKIDALCAFFRCNADLLILDDIMIDRDQINDLDSVRDALEKIQNKVRDKYYQSALRELLDPSISNRSTDITNFFDFNLRLTNFYCHDRLQVNLLNFLFDRNKSRDLYIDQYHFSEVKNLLRLIGESFDDVIGSYHIINDTFKDGLAMKANSDFILYNFSGFFNNPFCSAEIPNALSLGSFYKLNDKIYKFIFPNEVSVESTDANQLILSSYEHKIDASIDDFFATLRM